MNKYIFAGSFNPFTIGHLSVVNNAKLVLPNNEIVVGITQNPNKKNVDIEALKWQLNPTNLKVVTVKENTLAEHVINNGYSGIIRSLRNSIDLVQETDLATWNRELFNVQTLFIPMDNSLNHISSSAIRELHKLNVDSLGKDIGKYFINDLQFKRWKNGKPKRIIITSNSMGSGKTTFKNMYFDRDFCSDLDYVVKKDMKLKTASLFKTFFNDTKLEDINDMWFNPSNELESAKNEVEYIINNHIKRLSFNLTNVYELSALTAYNLDYLYEDSIIVNIEKFEAGIYRKIDDTFKAKADSLKQEFKCVDFTINSDIQSKDEIRNIVLTILDMIDD